MLRRTVMLAVNKGRLGNVACFEEAAMLEALVLGRTLVLEEL